MKARRRRPSAFIVFECLEILMKHKARVYGMASQKGQPNLLTINTKTERHVNSQFLFSFVALTHMHSCNFEKWKKHLRKGLPGFDRR